MWQVLFCMLVATSAVAQENPFRKKLLLQADEMGWCLLHKDYDALMTYMIPGVVQMMGGKASMKATLRKEYLNLEEKGYHLVAVNFDEPGELIDSAGLLQCIIPEQQTMKAKHGDIIVPATVLAVSGDGGSIWRFVELEPGKTQKIRALDTRISGRLVHDQ